MSSSIIQEAINVPTQLRIPNIEMANCVLSEAKILANLVKLSNATETMDKKLFIDFFNGTSCAQDENAELTRAVFCEAQLLTTIHSSLAGYDRMSGFIMALANAFGAYDTAQRWTFLWTVTKYDDFGRPESTSCASKNGIYSQRCHNAHELRVPGAAPRGKRQWQIMRDVYPLILADCKDVVGLVEKMLPECQPEAPQAVNPREEHGKEEWILEKDLLCVDKDGKWITQEVLETPWDTAMLCGEKGEWTQTVGSVVCRSGRKIRRRMKNLTHLFRKIVDSHYPM